MKLWIVEDTNFSFMFCFNVGTEGENRVEMLYIYIRIPVWLEDVKSPVDPHFVKLTIEFDNPHI